MATLSAARADGDFQQGGGEFRAAWGTYVLATNSAAATIIEFCRVPAGATVVGGTIYAVDLDTNATEELDIDFGWAANGVDDADAAGFGNMGPVIWTGDVIAGYTSVASSIIPLQGKLIADGPITFGAETVIQAVVNVDAATGGTGRISLVVYYHTA